MGRIVTNGVKPVVRVNVSPTDWKGIANLAQTVHDTMLANVADYPVPTPLSAAFQTDIDSLVASLALLGTKFNKGGSGALAQVKADAFIVFADLTQTAFYVQTIVNGSDSSPEQALLIAKSGFAAKSKRSRVPKNQFVKRARQTNNKKFPQTLRRVAWQKPLGNFSGFRPKAYNIYGKSNGNAAIQFLTTVTATNYMAPSTFTLNGIQLPLNTLVIRPVTATGEGNSFSIDVK